MKLCMASKILSVCTVEQHLSVWPWLKSVNVDLNCPYLQTVVKSRKEKFNCMALERIHLRSVQLKGVALCSRQPVRSFR